MIVSITFVDDNFEKIEKNTEWKRKKSWKKIAISIEVFSKMFAMSENVDDVVQTFVNDDDEQVTFANEIEITKSESMKMFKKKKTIKRIVRKNQKTTRDNE